MKQRRFTTKGLFYLFLAGAGALLLSGQPGLADFLVVPDAYWQLEAADPIVGVSADVGSLNGTCINCPTSTGGQVGQGLDFAANPAGQAEVVFADDPVFDWAEMDSFAIEFWMNISIPPGNRQVMIGRNDSIHWWLGVDPDESVVGFFVNSGGGEARVQSGSSVADGNWHHIAVVSDSGTGALMLFVDGVHEATATFDAPGGFDGNGPVTLGRLPGSGNFWYTGLMDNLAVYSGGAVSADAVRQNYLNALSGHALADPVAPLFIPATRTETLAAGYLATMQATAAGNPMPVYSADGLPAGAVIDSADGKINWLPDHSQLGPHNFTINAAGAANNQAWSVNVLDLCTEALQAYWKLEENGGPFIDEIAGLNGECTSCPVQAEGRASFGFGQTFNAAAGTEIVIPANPVFDWAVDGDFSIELWINMAQPAARQVIIGRDDPTALLHWWIAVEDDGSLLSYFVDNGDGQGRVQSVTNVSDNLWHHIVVVRNGAAGRLMLYIDGVLQASQAYTALGDFSSTGNVILGNIANLPGQYRYNGSLDEVAVYQMALTPDIIAEHMENPDRAYCGNNLPVITSTAPATAVEGTAYAYAAQASDADGDPLVWALVDAPDWLVIDSATGAVSGVPPAGSAGSSNYRVQVTDGFGGSDSEPVALTISAATAPSVDPPVTPDDPGPAAPGNDSSSGGCFIGTVDWR